MSELTAKPSESSRRFHWRRLFQYSLRALLILTTIIAVALGWWSYKARQQREAVAAFEKIQRSGCISYDCRLPWTGGMDDPPKWPQWLLDTVGVDYFASVQMVCLNNTKVTDAGLEHLKGLTALKHVSLNNTQVTDAGVARLQKALPSCKIDR